MAENQEFLTFDPGKLTTSERRMFVDRMQRYLEYFQKMQERAENRNVIDRVIKKIKSKDAKKEKEKELERLEKYMKLLSKAFEKTTVGIKANDNRSDSTLGNTVAALSGAAGINITLERVGGGVLAGGGVGMAVSTVMPGGLFCAGFLDTITGMSDKEQAVFYKKMCETLMGVVSAFNVPEEIVKQELLKTMERIGEIKEKYKDISDEEKMAKLIQDECVVDLTTGIEGTKDCEAFKEKVLGVIGKGAWNKMSSNSQIFIVTAELLFEQWKIYEDGIDFGPICLSASKALEVEVTRRYFIGFKEYLENTRKPLIDEMYKKDGTVKMADDYMLGNLTGITGYVVYLDTQKVKLVSRLTDINQLFLEYAKKELFKGKSENQCSEIVKEHLLNIKNVCENYRNPAAHKQKMSKVSARECLDFMIDVKRVLGKMLDDCDW